MKTKVTKTYHFYAAHRNPNLKGSKCEYLHGHTYDVEVTLQDFTTENGISIEFSEIDMKLAPYFKQFDHAVLVCRHDDRLMHARLAFPEVFGKTVLTNHDTSVELLCKKFIEEIDAMDLPIYSISIKETKSSKVTIKADEVL